MSASFLITFCRRAFLVLLMAAGSNGAWLAVAADEFTARAAMERQDNPLVMLSTARGTVYIELLPMEAPRNVANFIALTEGSTTGSGPRSGQAVASRFYDGKIFHRTVPGLLIQAGSPLPDESDSPATLLADEINANALGLDRMPAVLPDGSFNPLLQIRDREDLEDRVLIPLYRALDIDSNADVIARQFEIDQRLRNLSIKEIYQNQGYRYTERFPTRPVTRGTVALANGGPDTNGGEFFITVADAPWLNGRHTVIGRVVEGIEVIEQISQIPVSPTSRAGSTLIFSARVL